MASQRFNIDGFGQVELNNVAFRRDGRIEAQCKLDKDDFAQAPCENGMLLCVDNVTRTVKFPEDGDEDKYPIALVYSAEHQYDERTGGLKDFKLQLDEFLPRLGYLSVGDKFTTNCLSFDTSKDDSFTGEDPIKTALVAETLKTTPVYGGICDNGTILVTKVKPDKGPVLLAMKSTTMPDGQFGIKFQVLTA